MDALKKAELAKHQGPDASATSTPEPLAELSLEPIADFGQTDEAVPAPTEREEPSTTKLPHLPDHLEALDEQFLAEAAQAATARLRPPPPAPPAAFGDAPGGASTAAAEAPRKPAPSAATQDKTAAQNLFAAKQPDKPPARKSFAIAVGVLTMLSVLGIGGYFWWQLQPKSPQLASRAPPAPIAIAPVAAVPPPAAAVPAPTPAVPPAAPVAGATGVAPPAPSAAPARNETAAAAQAAAPVPPHRARAAEPTPAEADGPVRVTRAPLKVNPSLIRGFDAFNRGDLAAAQVDYERAQKADPRNTDALHGLAAIALRQGRLEQADWLYRQIIEADPQDTVAMSALINNRAQIDPGAAESRLKSLAATQPELAAPHFALGNLYARDGRWNDAQQAYFRAYGAEPDNPDILYNLAISLEHLRQNKLAAQYYGQAIAAAQSRPAGFDKAQAAARLSILQP